MNKSQSPLFYEFNIHSPFDDDVRESTTTEGNHIKSVKLSEGKCTLLSLNNLSPESEDSVKSKLT